MSFKFLNRCFPKFATCINEVAMERITIILFAFVLIFQGCKSSAQPQGYQIGITVNGWQNATVQFAFQDGNKKYLHSTHTLDSTGSLTLQDTLSLDQGIFAIILPDGQAFEFMIDEDQHFRLSTQKDDLIASMVVNGSVVNELMYKDLSTMASYNEQYADLNSRLETEDNTDSINAVEERMETVVEKSKAFRQELKDEHPESFYIKYLKAVEDLIIPQALKDSMLKIDSLFEYKYYKAHWFDHLDFKDDRLVRTPAYHKKVNQYLDYLTEQSADSLIEAIDMVFGKIGENYSYFKFTLSWLLGKYSDPKVMGLDGIYVHLAETYYTSGKVDWISEAEISQILQDAQALKPFLVGKKSPDIQLYDKDGNLKRLYDINKRYTVVYFWDATCDRCRRQTPRFHEVYLKYKNRDVDFLAVCADLTPNHWLTFIQQKNLTWTNVINTGPSADVHDVYRIETVPMAYVLDRDKNIVAKKMPYNVLDNWLEHHLAKPEE